MKTPFSFFHFKALMNRNIANISASSLKAYPNLLLLLLFATQIISINLNLKNQSTQAQRTRSYGTLRLPCTAGQSQSATGNHSNRYAIDFGMRYEVE